MASDILREEAERAVRRGELSEALRLYGQIQREQPADGGIAARVATIQSLLQPAELSQQQAAERAPAPVANAPGTAEQMAEMLFERGDYSAALAAYGRILEGRPEHQLARERYEEISKLVDIAPRRSVEPPLPKDRGQMLEALLARIAMRRR